jgi:hypothetical protein
VVLRTQGKGSGADLVALRMLRERSSYRAMMRLILFSRRRDQPCCAIRVASPPRETLDKIGRAAGRITPATRSGLARRPVGFAGGFRGVPESKTGALDPSRCDLKATQLPDGVRSNSVSSSSWDTENVERKLRLIRDAWEKEVAP